MTTETPEEFKQPKVLKCPNGHEYPAEAGECPQCGEVAEGAAQ